MINRAGSNLQTPEDIDSSNDAIRDAAQVRLALKDRRAFEPLYHRYGDRIWRYALQRTGSAAIADDVLSETVLATLESLERFDADRGSFASWIFTIASRRISDHQRGHRRLWRLINRIGSQRQDTMPDTATSILQTADAARVREAISHLSETDQEVVILRYGADLPSATIAEILGLTDGAVRVRLHRARQRLANELEDIR